MRETSGAADSERLIKLLSRQRVLYQKLKELSERQRGMISGDRADLLLGILQERQGHVNELVLLNKQLSPFRRDWDQTLASLADDARQVVSKLLAVINTLLSGILATDKEDGALLSARKQMVASELSGLSGGRIANQCYARSMPATGTSSADLTG
ncbi:MAG: flagellar export chaperone FlgN [Planctomycetes bacterium]|nr:flagellar export chaperone FlgN [Planctomycetota bacterium]